VRLRCTILLLLSSLPSLAQLPQAEIQGRVSRISRFEFSLYNSGLLYGDHSVSSGRIGFAPSISHWPRGSGHFRAEGGATGLVFLAMKEGRHVVSDNGYARLARLEHGPFDQMVPGTIGGSEAGYDSVFHGAGWRYVVDPDYIVYSSLDFNGRGVDTSGANMNDWPIRLVNGQARYVGTPQSRSSNPPVFRSDEDLVTVFKDTDTRADQVYTGPNGHSIPIGLEIVQAVLSWGTPPLQDIVLFTYDIANKGGGRLDSCFIMFSFGLQLDGWTSPRPLGLSRQLTHVRNEPTDPLWAIVPTDTTEWWAWSATARPPTTGHRLLETPTGYDNLPCRTKRVSCPVFQYRISSPDSAGYLVDNWEDSTAYRVLSRLEQDLPWTASLCEQFASGPAMLTGPFDLEPGQECRLVAALVFSDSVSQLLLLDDLVKRMHAHGYQRPSAPPAPVLVATGLNRAVRLTWDRRAEESPDVIVPDSLGRPFTGYRLLRSVTEGGPYTELARWSVDSLIVHEYIDRGEGIGGLKNNVRYYYQLLAFDEGAPRIKLEPMESKPEQGVNWVSAIPGASASDLTTSSGTGALASGTLGNVSTPQLVPVDNTNFANLFSGKSIELNVTAATDGIRYTLPVTVRDTISGREQFAVLDPGLFVGGTPAMAGVKEGVLHIPDVFGLGGARIDLPYRFEQTDDTLALAEPVIESPTGADVPVLVRDSMHTTGIQTLTPYIESGRELVIEFLPGGIDTISYIFGFILPYRDIRITDGATGEELEPGVDWTVRLYITRAQGGPQGNSVRNRYYLSGPAPNGFELHAGHLLTINNSVVVFDYPDRGRGSGKPSPTFPWGSGHRAGTRDFQVGDRVRIGWDGGVRGLFPRDAVLTLTGPAPGQTEVTENMLEKVRIVPNPYMIRHEAQRGAPRVYFNYLPEECTITIYTVALDRIATLQHRGGSREEWNLMTERGQLVASQLLFASIEAPNGKRVTKKFAVILGR
jgi:hypothetical protein